MRLRAKTGKRTLCSNSWLSVPKPKPDAKIRLLCFPYAGGLKEIYMPWTAKVDDNVELVIIQYPGHLPGNNEVRFEDMELLVKELLPQLDSVFDKPYALYGHSMGCRVILKLIESIYKSQKTLPYYIFLAANKPLHMSVVQPPIQHLTIDEAVKVIKHFNILPDEITDNKDILEMILPIYISDFKLLDSFSIDTKIFPLHIPICCFSGIDDNLAYPKDMKEWERYTDAGFEVVELKDKHYFINNNDLRQSIVDKVMQCLLKKCML